MSTLIDGKSENAHANAMLASLHSVFVMLLAACSGQSDRQTLSRFVAVIDAGSSGSIIVLYERKQEGKTLRVAQRSTDTAGQALSSFETKPADAGHQGVDPLIQTLSTHLRASCHSVGDVQVHLLAPAGMRLVEARNPAAATAIYASARSYLESTGVRPGRIETLSVVD